MKVVLFSQRLANILRKIAYSFLIILCVVNILFFVTHWSDIQITLSDEGILLSVVGFFFAFAGINIYSIFNTNVETEKQRIRELADEYKANLERDEMLLKFPKEMIRIFHNCLYLTSVDSFQYYSYDSMAMLEKLLNNQHAFIQNLKDTRKNDAYEQCVSDSREMAASMLSLLKRHRDSIKYNGFFSAKPDEEDNYSKRLNALIKTVDDIQYDNYDIEEQIIEEPQSIVEKLYSVYQFAKNVFKKK